MSETGRILIEKLDIYAYHGFFSEEELGATLLALVASARGQGLDAERALHPQRFFRIVPEFGDAEVE